MTPFQDIGPGLNVILTYGQSNAFGTQAHPSLMLPVSLRGIWMLGASHRGAYEGSNATRQHKPIGDIDHNANVLYLLRSTTLNNDRDRVLSYAEEAALSARKPCDRDIQHPEIYGTCENGNGGESIGVLFTAYLRQRIISLRGGVGDLVLVDCSEPGQTLENLTSGPTPSTNFFPRIETAFQLIAEAARTRGEPVRHIATLFVQGSQDYGAFTNVGGTCSDPPPPPPPPPQNPTDPPNVCVPTTPTETYVGLLKDLFTKIDNAAIAKFTAANQTQPAVGIIMQTSGRGITGGRYSVSISRAQQEFARALIPGGGTRGYPIIQQVGAEHGIHFTNNGARIAALAAARGAEAVLFRNERHMTVAPVELPARSPLGPAYRGRDLLIPFTAPATLCFRPILTRRIPAREPVPPEPPIPLRLQMITTGNGTNQRTTYGFAAYDGASALRLGPQGEERTPVPLEGVYWLGERVLCLRAQRDWVGEVTVGCGYRLVGGRTNVSTTDQRDMGFNYIYLPPNAGLPPPPTVTVMEEYENAVNEGGTPLNGTPLPTTEFSLVFEIKVSAAPPLPPATP